MKYIKLFVLLLLFSELVGRSLEKSVHSSILEERVDGDLFTYRLDTVDGVCTQKWAVNGEEISEKEYEKRLTRADVNERKRERIRQKKQAYNNHKRTSHLQRVLLQRTLKDLIAQTKQELDKVSDYRLRAYLVFDEVIPSIQQLDYLHNTLLLFADSLLKDKEASLRELQDMVNQLEPYPEALENLLQRSVEHACEVSDDTRLLKDLLNFVSA